ncbi:DMT family transporter [Brevibacterium salitolerans]|jgi:quaternary ammonium compound-resistance protein SugE|uniref:Multidrug efflux SMR transporter n=1 Tax=Brevibacterium salitolerans TaxID=1403566 RepID=A0ABP5HWZ8_9MICO
MFTAPFSVPAAAAATSALALGPPHLPTGIAWTVLIVSGAFETMWAYALAADGMRMPRRIALFLVGTVLSMGGLALALDSIPVGTGYAVWVGIGAVTTLAFSVLRREESLNWLRAGFAALLICGVIGMKVAS